MRQFQSFRVSLLIGIQLISFLVPSLVFGVGDSDFTGPTLQRIKSDKSIRIGMYLAFEGLSFRERGTLQGLEVEIADLLVKELSKELQMEIRPEIVNQEWSQIIKVLRDKKYDVVLSAVIPSRLYDRYQVRYSLPYLQTGPSICCQEIEGNPTPGITQDVESLRGKKIVVINDPAVRHAIRSRGIYVEADANETEIERHFPKWATQQTLLREVAPSPLIPVSEIVQIDEMPIIYEMIASGKVDAGIIDQGIVWWVSNHSPRWAQRIHSFPNPIAPYIYCAVTRKEDTDLADAIDHSIESMLRDPAYSNLYQRWHGPGEIDWQLNAQAFLDLPRPAIVTSTPMLGNAK